MDTTNGSFTNAWTRLVLLLALTLVLPACGRWTPIRSVTVDTALRDQDLAFDTASRALGSLGYTPEQEVRTQEARAPVAAPGYGGHGKRAPSARTQERTLRARALADGNDPARRSWIIVRVSTDGVVTVAADGYLVRGREGKVHHTLAAEVDAVAAAVKENADDLASVAKRLNATPDPVWAESEEVLEVRRRMAATGPRGEGGPPLKNLQRESDSQKSLDVVMAALVPFLDVAAPLVDGRRRVLTGTRRKEVGDVLAPMTENGGFTDVKVEEWILPDVVSSPASPKDPFRPRVRKLDVFEGRVSTYFVAQWLEETRGDTSIRLPEENARQEWLARLGVMLETELGGSATPHLTERCITLHGLAGAQVGSVATALFCVGYELGATQLERRCVQRRHYDQFCVRYELSALQLTLFVENPPEKAAAGSARERSQEAATEREARRAAARRAAAAPDTAEADEARARYDQKTRAKQQCENGKKACMASCAAHQRSSLFYTECERRCLDISCYFP